MDHILLNLSWRIVGLSIFIALVIPACSCRVTDPVDIVIATVPDHLQPEVRGMVAIAQGSRLPIR